MHLTVSSGCIVKIVFKHFLVKLCLYKLYFSLNTNCKCVINRTTGASSTEAPRAGGKQEEVFISIQAFPALLDVAPSCEVMAVSCGSRHTAAVTSKKKKKNLQYLQSLMLIAHCHFSNLEFSDFSHRRPLHVGLG